MADNFVVHDEDPFEDRLIEFATCLVACLRIQFFWSREELEAFVDEVLPGGEVIYGLIPRTKNGPALADYRAVAMANALAETIKTLPEQLRRSVTWGSWEGTLRSCQVHCRNRRSCLLRRRPESLAAREQ